MSNTEGNSSSPGLPAVLDDALDALARPPRPSGLFGRGQADVERWELLAGTLRTVREQVARATDDARAASQKADVAEARLGTVTREFDKARQQSSQLFAAVRHKLDALQAELDQSRAALTERLGKAEDTTSAGDRELAASIEAGSRALADARAALAASIDETNSSLAALGRTREEVEAQIRADAASTRGALEQSIAATQADLSSKLGTGLSDLAAHQQAAEARLDTAIGAVRTDLTRELGTGLSDLATQQQAAETRLDTAIGAVRTDLTKDLGTGLSDLAAQQQAAETRLDAAVAAVRTDLTKNLGTGLSDLAGQQQAAETRLDAAIGAVRTDLTKELGTGLSDLAARQQAAATRLDAAVGAVRTDLTSQLTSTRSELEESVTALAAAREAAEDALRSDLQRAVADAQSRLSDGLDQLRTALASEAETSAQRSAAAALDLDGVRTSLAGFREAMQGALAAEATSRTDLATGLEAAIVRTGEALGGRIDGLTRDRDAARAAFDEAITAVQAELASQANGLAAGRTALAAAEQALGARLEALSAEQTRAATAATAAVAEARSDLEARIAAVTGVQADALEALRAEAGRRFSATDSAINRVQAALDSGLLAANSAFAARADELAGALDAVRGEDTAGREALQRRMAQGADELRGLLGTVETSQARAEAAFADLRAGLEGLIAGVGARIDRLLAAGQSAVAEANDARSALATELAALKERQAELDESLNAGRGTQAHLAEDVGSLHADIEGLQAALHDASKVAGGRRAELEASLAAVRAEFEGKLSAISSQLAAIPSPAVMLRQGRASELKRLRYLEDGLLAAGGRLGGQVLEAAGGAAAFDGRLAETLRAILGTAVQRRILMLGDPGDAGRLLIALLQGLGHQVTLLITDDFSATVPGGGQPDAFANIWADNGAGATPDWMLVGPLLHGILAAQLQVDPEAPVARRARTMLEFARFKITAARDSGAVSRPWTSADFAKAAKLLGLTAQQRRHLRPYLLADLLLARFRRLWEQLTGDAAVAGSMSTPLQPGLVEAVKGLDPVFDRAVARLRRWGLADAVGFEGAALARIDRPDPTGGAYDTAQARDRAAGQSWCSPFWRGLFARFDLVGGFGAQGAVPWLAGHNPILVAASEATLASDAVVAAAAAAAQLTLTTHAAAVARPLDVLAPLTARAVDGLVAEGAPAAVAVPVVATIPPEQLDQLSQRIAGVENRTSVVDLHGSDLDWLKNRIIEVGNALNLVEVQTGSLVETSIKADSGVDFLNTRVGELSMDLFHVRNALGLKLTESITSYSVVDRLQDVILHARASAAEIQVRAGNRALPRQPVRTEAMPVDEIWAEFARRAPHNIETFREAFDVGAASYVGFPVGSCSVSGAPLAHQFSRFVSSYIVNSSATLDVGCGPQAKPLYLEMADPDSIHGVDILAPYEPHPFPYVQTAGEFLPWEDESFDLLLSGGALDHYYLLDVGMEEAWRVLRPGGHFVGNITLFDDAPPYDPYAGPMEAYDEEHLFHINMAWFEPFMRERGFELVELMQFHQPFIYGIMAFKKVEKPRRHALKPPARGGKKK